jgi:multimeric flavodoxin WrbA
VSISAITIMMDTPLNVLVVNTSLKKGDSASSTEEVAAMVLAELEKHGPITASQVRIADKNVPLGLNHKMADDDEWPEIAEAIGAADIVIFATPIWWGQRSSLMQRVIERMDSMDAGDAPAHLQREKMLNKVAGIVVTGSEDGAQQIMASLMEFLSFLNFTMPPQCCTYWVGEVGMDPKTDSERRRKNPAVQKMAELTARNLHQVSRALKANPLTL